MKRFTITEKAPGFYNFNESANGEWVSYTDAVAERRERIATACLAGLLADPEAARKLVQLDFVTTRDVFVSSAVEYADSLIAALDKETDQ